VALHPDAVAQDRSTRERRVGIGGKDGDGIFLLAEKCNEGVDKRRLPGARRTSEAHHPRVLVCLGKRVLELAHRRIATLDQADRPGQSAYVAGTKTV
jgi:hypothetical protein